MNEVTGEFPAVTSTLRGPRSAAEVCRARGWGPGTYLAGDEGHGVTIIRISAVGAYEILAREVAHAGRAVGGTEAPWVLWCRDWREVDESEVPAPLPLGQAVTLVGGIEGRPSATITSGPDHWGQYGVELVADGRRGVARPEWIEPQPEAPLTARSGDV